MVDSAGKSPLSDEKVVSRCLDGDERAWQLLIDRYKALIYSVPLKSGLSEDEAADVFQNTIVALYRNLERLRSASRLSYWLTTTAARLSWAAAKAGNRRSDATDIDELAVAEEFLSERELIELERRHIVRSAVEQLPELCRKLIRALLLAPKPASYREVAEDLDLPQGSLGPTRARCLKKLKRILTKRGFGE